MNIVSEKKLIKDSWINWTQLFFIGMTSPFFLFPSLKHLWILFIVPGIWIFRWAIEKDFFIRTILDWAMAILFIQVLATCLIVPDLAFSLPKISGILFGLFFFYSIVALLTSKKLIKLGILGFLVTGLILSVIGILGIQWDKFDPNFNKIIPKMPEIIPKIKWNLPGAEEGFNSNAIGGTLILMVPLCIVLFFSYFNKKKENYLISHRILALIFFSAIFLIINSVLFLTFSIGSWIALLISIWILLFRGKWKKWSLLLIFLSIALLFLFNYDGTKFQFDEFKNNIEKRMAFWEDGINTISKYPIFGIGMNRIRELPTVGYMGSHVHNHLLHTAAELGIPGLIAYLAILMGAGYMCFQIWQKSKIGWMKITALCLGCGQLAHFIFGVLDSIPLGAKVGIFFWFSLALVTAVYNFTIKRDTGSC